MNNKVFSQNDDSTLSFTSTLKKFYVSFEGNDDFLSLDNFDVSNIGGSGSNRNTSFLSGKDIKC